MSVTQDMEQSFFAVCTSKGYNITKMLGEGSFGKVYLGTRAPKLTASPTDDGRYAIKLALDNDMLHEVHIYNIFSYKRAMTKNIFLSFFL